MRENVILVWCLSDLSNALFVIHKIEDNVRVHLKLCVLLCVIYQVCIRENKQQLEKEERKNTQSVTKKNLLHGLSSSYDYSASLHVLIKYLIQLQLLCQVKDSHAVFIV